MFLIDSSAWIEYLRNNGSPAVKKRVREILEAEEATTCSVVIVEILRGARDDKSFNALKETLMSLPQLAIDDAAIERAGKWGCMLGRKGKTVPTTDLMIASSAYNKSTVVHVDEDFETIASVCSVKAERIKR